MNRRLLVLIAALGLLLGLSVVTPANAAGWREYTSSGRQWREKCETYSSTVERCRTEIWATVATWNGRRYTTTDGWAFNNLLYKPSPRAQWVGNPLATPGEHTIDGRRWKTECDTAWTGRHGCRSMIWTRGAHFNGKRYVHATKWVFNNIVQFRPAAPTTPPTTTPTPDPNPGPAPDTTPGATVAISRVSQEHVPSGSIHRSFAPIHVTGKVTGSVPGTEVTIQLMDHTSDVRGTTTARTNTDGGFAASLDASFAGWAQVVVTLGSDHDPASREFTILPTSLTQQAPAQIDPLAPATITGQLTPKLPNVLVQARTQVNGQWQVVGAVRTGMDGSYSMPWAYNVGTLGTTQVRVRALTEWGTTIETGETSPITRMRWPNTEITTTTSEEVASTYRAGCPVPPSNLRTIRINQQGMDDTVHRGEIIVRADLAAKVADSFEQVFAAGFPVAQMRNPNAWNGSDEKMMAANNTSAFNCRRVVGNPTALSPHSYGKAIDFNPVQNPYRDPSGKWWPSSQYSVNRPEWVPGLHTARSASVKAFTGHGFRWFSGWDWHHFEYPNTARATLTVGPASDETGHHAVDPVTKGTDVLAVGCAPTTTNAPQPVGASEAPLTSDGRPGISVTMQFRSEKDARVYFGAWQSQMQACVGSSVTEARSSEDTWLGQWDVDGTQWAEAAGQRGDTVKLTLLDDDLAAADLEAIVADY